MTTVDLTDFDPIHAALNVVIEALKPLSVDQRRSVLESAAHLFGNVDALPPSGQQVTTLDSQSNPPDLERFVIEKKTNNAAIAVTVLAYYLTVYRKQPTFKSADLDALSKEAGMGQTFGNINKTVNNATQRIRLLDRMGDGSKRINLWGRRVVDALPDEEKVKAVLEEHKAGPKRKPRKKKEQ